MNIFAFQPASDNVGSPIIVKRFEPLSRKQATVRRHISMSLIWNEATTDSVWPMRLV